MLVATIRALKMHGGKDQNELTEPDADAVRAGLPNLDKHIESIRHFGQPPVVALNRFGNDTDEEIRVVREHCAELNVPFAISDHHAKGGEGAIELAKTVMEQARTHHTAYTPLYELSDPVPDKIRRVAQTMYGATDVVFTKAAETRSRRHQAARVREASGLHRQDTELALGRSQAPRPSR